MVCVLKCLACTFLHAQKDYGDHNFWKLFLECQHCIVTYCEKPFMCTSIKTRDISLIIVILVAVLSSSNSSSS